MNRHIRLYMKQQGEYYNMLLYIAWKSDTPSWCKKYTQIWDMAAYMWVHGYAIKVQLGDQEYLQKIKINSCQIINNQVKHEIISFNVNVCNINALQWLFLNVTLQGVVCVRPVSHLWSYIYKYKLYEYGNFKNRVWKVLWQQSKSRKLRKTILENKHSQINPDRRKSDRSVLLWIRRKCNTESQYESYK